MHTRKSARLLILNSHQEMLLFQHRDEHQPPFWATPGGELRKNESYRDAAQRELFEETGFEVEVGTLWCERDAVFPVARSTPARWLEHYFVVDLTQKQPITTLNWTDEEKSTIQKWRWWSLADMLATAQEFKPEWLPHTLTRLQNDTTTRRHST